MNTGNSLLRLIRVAAGLAAAALLLGACSMAGLPSFAPASPQLVAEKSVAARSGGARPQVVAEIDADFTPLAYVQEPARGSSIDGLIAKYAALYDVPESLIRRVVKRESGYNPRARNGPYLGLMQIRHDTARSMGYSGSASGLLDAETNLKYAVRYLRGAYLVAGYNSDGAIRYYSRGYYYDAKHMGLLDEVGFH